MGRYNSNKTTSKYVKDYIKNKIWERDKDEYIPFLCVRDVPTKGKAYRIKGWKTGREHHFLSKLEYGAFLYFEWSGEVVDIKEQFPLLPVEKVQSIAEDAGIEYPTVDGKPIVMTTDFNIKVLKNGYKSSYIRTVKPSSELNNPRTLEKFEIERRFFQTENIDWGIITEKDISIIFVNNIEILHSINLSDNGTNRDNIYKFSIYEHLINEIQVNNNEDYELVHIFTSISSKLHVNLSSIFDVFLKAIIDGVLVVDLYNHKLNLTELKVNDIKVNQLAFTKFANSIGG